MFVIPCLLFFLSTLILRLCNASYLHVQVYVCTCLWLCWTVLSCALSKMLAVFAQVEKDKLGVTVVRRPAEAMGPNSDIQVHDSLFIFHFFVLIFAQKWLTQTCVIHYTHKGWVCWAGPDTIKVGSWPKMVHSPCTCVYCCACTCAWESLFYRLSVCLCVCVSVSWVFRAVDSKQREI